MSTEALHTKRFHVFIPEYYVTKIPTYFTEPRKPRPPMVNGVPVSVEEYQTIDPEYEPDTEFIPEPIYDPFEHNMTFSTKTVVEIYDAYDNNVNVVFKDPQNITEMITLINNYVNMARLYTSSSKNMREWCEKLTDFAEVLKTTYNEYIKRVNRLYPHKYPQAGRKTLSEFLSLFKGQYQ